MYMCVRVYTFTYIYIHINISRYHGLPCTQKLTWQPSPQGSRPGTSTTTPGKQCGT